MTPNGKSAIFQVKFRFPKRKDFTENLKVFISDDHQSGGGGQVPHREDHLLGGVSLLEGIRRVRSGQTL